MPGLRRWPFSLFLNRNTEAKIIDQLNGRLLRRKIEEPCRKPDHITLFLASETDEVPVNLHARGPVIVKRTAGHPGAIDLDAVVVGSLPGGNSRLHFFEQVHKSSYKNAIGSSYHFANMILISGHKKRASYVPWFSKNKMLLVLDILFWFVLLGGLSDGSPV